MLVTDCCMTDPSMGTDVTPVKSRMPPEERSRLGKRIDLIREYLGGRKPFSYDELVKDLRRHFGQVAPSRKTVIRWTSRETIDPEHAQQLAELSQCDREWVMSGQGRKPGTVTVVAEPPPVYAPAPAIPKGADGQDGEDRPDSEKRSPRGLLLRAIATRYPNLDELIRRRGVEHAAFDSLLTNQAGQMLADRVAAVVRATFSKNEIANTESGRRMTIAFLGRVAREFASMGLDVSDILLYKLELEEMEGQ